MRSWEIAKVVILGMPVCLSAGCGNANWYSIYRQTTLVQDHQIAASFIDAQQRAVIASSYREKDGALVAGVCAEPSPDALQLISSQASANAKANLSGSESFEAGFQTGSAATAAQLTHRSSSIQLLRDTYYRLCEANLNGFMQKGDYKNQLKRLSDALVVTLAIEQLTPSEIPLATYSSPTLKASSDTPARQAVKSNADKISPSRDGARVGGQAAAKAHEAELRYGFRLVAAVNAAASQAMPQDPPAEGTSPPKNTQGAGRDSSGALAANGNRSYAGAQVPAPSSEVVDKVARIVESYLERATFDDCIYLFSPSNSSTKPPPNTLVESKVGPVGSTNSESTDGRITDVMTLTGVVKACSNLLKSPVAAAGMFRTHH